MNLYCIHHGYSGWVEKDVDGNIYHIVPVVEFDGRIGYDACEFISGWAYNEPPENFAIDAMEDWEKYVEEPSAEELAMMDANAEELLMEIA